MVEETGIVTAVDGRYAWVQTQRQSACGACAANKGCGTGILILSQVFRAKPWQVRAVTAVSVKVGERVVVGLSEDAFLRAALLCYGGPVVALFVGGVVGELFNDRWFDGQVSWLSVLWAFLFFLVAIPMLRQFAQRWHNSEQYCPRIVRRVNP